MEGNKNAMYVEAGRIRGWQVVSGEAPVKIPEAPGKSVTMPMPEAIPAPPVIVMPMPEAIPTPPVIAMPNAEIPPGGCQGLAMAYVKTQKWQETYEPEQGFARGTLFTELDLPFVGEGACKHG